MMQCVRMQRLEPPEQRTAVRPARTADPSSRIRATILPILPRAAANPRVFVRTQPLTAFRNAHGTWFAMLAIHTPPTNQEAERLANQLLTALEHHATMPALPNTPAEWLPEYLSALRDVLAALPKRPAVTWSACMGITMRNVCGDQYLACTSTGSLRATVVTTVSGSMRATDIIDPEQSKPEIQFTDLVEGALGRTDALLIGTTALFDALSPNDCSNLAHVLPETLSGADATAGGILIRFAPTPPSTPPHANASMESFLHTVASTEHLLTPSLAPSIRRLSTEVGAILRMFPALIRPGGERTTHRSGALTIAVRGIRLFFHALGVAARTALAMAADGMRLLLVGTGRAAAVTAALATRPQSRAALAAAVRPATTIARVRRWYGALPATSRHILLVAIAFAMLFLGSTGALWRRRVMEVDIATFNATINRIAELQSVAEARLLFGDRAPARVALRDAAAAVATLSRNTAPQRERVAAIEREVGASLDRARLLTRVAEPLAVTGDRIALPFSELGDIIPLGKSLAVFSADARTFATINPRSGDVRTFTLAPEPTLGRPFSVHTLDDRSLIVIDANARTVIADARTGATATTNIDAAPGSIRDAAVYQKRLYLLHPDGHITRHPRTAGGFGSGAMWHEASSETSGASALSVTGPVVVTHDDGRVRLYISGRTRDVDLTASIDPPLDGPSAVAVDGESRTIAFGDPREGRIIAVRDDGVLIGQIQSNAFRGLSRIAFDASGKSLYVLAGPEVYVVATPK